MPRHYGSFLIRCWRLESGERRIEIEHIPTGGRTRVTSVEAALQWISAQLGDPMSDALGRRPAEPRTEDRRTDG